VKVPSCFVDQKLLGDSRLGSREAIAMVGNEPAPADSLPPEQPASGNSSVASEQGANAKDRSSRWFQVFLVVLSAFVGYVFARFNEPSDELLYDFQTTDGILIKGERFYPTTFQLENLGSRAANKVEIHIAFEGEIVGNSFRRSKAVLGTSSNSSFDVGEVSLVKGESFRFTVVSRGRPVEKEIEVRSEYAIGRRSERLRQDVEKEKERLYAILMFLSIVACFVWLGVREVKKDNRQLRKQVIELGGKPT
jgi:hypothetical protein